MGIRAWLTSWRSSSGVRPDDPLHVMAELQHADTLALLGLPDAPLTDLVRPPVHPTPACPQSVSIAQAKAIEGRPGLQAPPQTYHVRAGQRGGGGAGSRHSARLHQPCGSRRFDRQPGGGSQPLTLSCLRAQYKFDNVLQNASQEEVYEVRGAHVTGPLQRWSTWPLHACLHAAAWRGHAPTACCYANGSKAHV